MCSSDLAQSRLLSLASRPFFLVADRILGAAFLSDISEFFTLFRTMEGPIVQRAKRVGALLSEPATSYLVVTSPESVAMTEAGYLVSELRQRGHRLEGVLVNRVVPSRLARGAADRASKLAASKDVGRKALAAAETEIAAIADRHAAALQQVTSWEVEVLVSEARSGDITDTDSLLSLGGAIHRG